MTSKLVTVIIATYDRRDTLSTAIQSALDQTYKPLELIVVDDGSNDATEDVVKSYSDSIRYIKQKRQGPSAARNNGIAHSKGRILSFLDSDDIWHKEMIQTQMQLMENIYEQIPCSICNAELIDDTGLPTYSFTHAKLQPLHSRGLWLNVCEVLASRFVLFNQTSIIRKDAIKQVGGFNEKLWLMEDYDLALKLSTLGHWGYVATPLVKKYTDTKNSLTIMAQKNKTQLYGSICDIYKNILQNGFPLTPAEYKNLKTSYSHFHRLQQAAKLKEKQNLIFSTAGRFVDFVQTKRRGFYRCLPTFAKMKIVPY
ncbi:MAG: glycosyltransferase family 2 protein [Phycisphaerae bacterium]|nr:glycosyltransferase family 2 protein [Phycisphaerae bacterium]